MTLLIFISIPFGAIAYPVINGTDAYICLGYAKSLFNLPKILVVFHYFLYAIHVGFVINFYTDFTTQLQIFVISPVVDIRFGQFARFDLLLNSI